MASLYCPLFDFVEPFVGGQLGFFKNLSSKHAGNQTVPSMSNRSISRLP